MPVLGGVICFGKDTACPSLPPRVWIRFELPSVIVTPSNRPICEQDRRFGVDKEDSCAGLVPPNTDDLARQSLQIMAQLISGR